MSPKTKQDHTDRCGRTHGEVGKRAPGRTKTRDEAEVKGFSFARPYKLTRVFRLDRRLHSASTWSSDTLTVTPLDNTGRGSSYEARKPTRFQLHLRLDRHGFRTLAVSLYARPATAAVRRAVDVARGWRSGSLIACCLDGVAHEDLSPTASAPTSTRNTFILYDSTSLARHPLLFFAFVPGKTRSASKDL